MKIKEIDYILANFDFKIVHDAMKAVNWEWRDSGVPSIKELKKTSRKLLEDCYKNNKNYSYSAGGFHASKDDDGVLYLDFIFESESSEFCD